MLSSCAPDTKVAAPALVDPHRAPPDYRAIPALVDGGRREENAPALGQRRDARATTERLRELVFCGFTAPVFD